MDVEGAKACVLTRDFEMLVLDISNPAAPLFQGGLDTGFEAANVVVRNSFAYFVNSGWFGREPGPGVHIVDITDPTQPKLSGSYISGDSERRCRLCGDPCRR